MQIIDQIRVEIAKKSYTVLKLSNETGIPSARIYKWLDNKGKPKVEDAKLLEEWLTKVEKVPQSMVQPGTPDSLNPAVNTRDREIDYQKEYIALLREQNMQMRERIDNKIPEILEYLKSHQQSQESSASALDLMTDYQSTILAYMKTVLLCQAKIRSQIEKIPVEVAMEEIRITLSEAVEDVLKTHK